MTPEGMMEPLQIIDERVTKNIERTADDMIEYTWVVVAHIIKDGALKGFAFEVTKRVLFEHRMKVDEYEENKIVVALNEKLREHGLPLIETEEVPKWHAMSH